MAGECKYSCQTSTDTLEWIHAIIDFLTPYTFLINAHVVNFFKDRLWENVDKEWIDCLRREPIKNLLLIPSGAVQDHWPTSLKFFILKLQSMVLHREQADLQMVLPGLQMTSLNSVVAQGMNVKKRHEVEVLSAVVSSITNSLGAHTIVDVGAGQVLSFQYQHSVVAIDACSHHGKVTNARAERIKKYYAAQMGKSGSGIRSLNGPKIITSRVLSIDSLKNLTELSLHRDDDERYRVKGESHADQGKLHCPKYANETTSSVLAGLHACGDLSVTMLKTFLECEEVKAVVSVGCCYNLLSEESIGDAGSQCGYPMSHALRSTGLSLGKSARDLACQSAERWKGLETQAGIHNFELHAFRAAFQMIGHAIMPLTIDTEDLYNLFILLQKQVLSKHYPEVMMNTPSIGRKGKFLRRRHQRRSAESQVHLKESSCSSLPIELSCMRQSCPCAEPAESVTDGILCSPLESQALPYKVLHNQRAGCEQTTSEDKYSLFENFCESGLGHLGIRPSHEIDFQGIWREAEPFSDLIGPYWSLRAALGPLLETLILLDRLLFLQEQGSVLEAYLLPIFDPNLSPRNVAIIAKKICSDTKS